MVHPEASWRFDGIPKRLIVDHFPAAVAGPEPSVAP
jgi:hypothetical protein